MEFKNGFGHGGLPDRDKIKDMYSHTRNPVPRQLTWDMTDAQITHFFWLTVPQPGNGKSLDVDLKGNSVTIVTRKLGEFDLNLDGRLIAFGQGRGNCAGRQEADCPGPSRDSPPCANRCSSAAIRTWRTRAG